MNNADVLKILNKVGEDFGWLMGKVGSNYENGYMKAIRDCKAVFQKDDHIVEANKMIVTNADRIRNMSDEELLKFINYESPSCTEFCDEFNEGCFHNCIRNRGEDVILQWLKEKVK